MTFMLQDGDRRGTALPLPPSLSPSSRRALSLPVASSVSPTGNPFRDSGVGVEWEKEGKRERGGRTGLGPAERALAAPSAIAAPPLEYGIQRAV